MANKNPSADSALIKSYFDRLLAIQSSVKELQMEYQQLLKDADVDGLERKAINPLINMVATENKARSEKLLNKLIEYGKHAGLELDVIPSVSQSALEPASQDTPAAQDVNALSNFYQERKPVGNKMALLLQTIVGLAAGATFVWLLR